MTKPIISVIVNFYKSERYISKLINSVLNQTFTDWELICINDCSPGKDLEILRKFQKHPKANNRIKIINNITNKGIAKSKKIGIENAIGTYITFIDGDDWLENRALEMLYEPAKKYNLDLVIMNNYRIIPYINYKWKISSNISADKYNVPIYSPELFEDYFINFFGCNIFATNSYWGKLYKLSSIKESNIKYPMNDTYEDNIFNFRLFPHIKSMMFIDYCGYYWRWGGITSGKKNNIYSESRFIKVIEDFYFERKLAIEKYNYTKAHKYLLFELKNVLKSMLSNIACYELSDKRSVPILTEIKKIISRMAYHDMKILYELHPNSKNDEFIKAIVNQDAKHVYYISHEIYKKERKKRLIKILIHKLIYPLARI